MKLKRKGRRARVVAAFAAACVAALAVPALLPSRAVRDERELKRLLERPREESLAELARPEGRARLLELFKRLDELGDERGLAELGALALDCPELTPGELTALLDVALSDLDTWNTALPGWKTALARRWLESGAPARFRRPWAHLFDRHDVTFVFRAPNGRHRRVFLSGNWTADGEQADLEGWGERPMRETPGGWTLRVTLRDSHYRHLYHAVVRSGRWPEGRALGWAVFPVNSERRVDVPAKDFPVESPSPVAVRSVPTTRLAILGVDGASWHVILPFVRMGLLPHFARLLREGALATPSSSRFEGYPSNPNTYSALTGKLPFRHAMVGDHLHIGARLASPLWTIASAQGLSSAVVDIYGSFPPDAVKGAIATEAFFVANSARDPNMARVALSPEVVRFAAAFGVRQADISKVLRWLSWIDRAFSTTWPDALADELRPRLPAIRVSPNGDLRVLVEGVEDQVIAATDYLTGREPHDLACVWLLTVDTMSHHLWTQFEPEPDDATLRQDARFRDEIERHWRPRDGDLLKAYRRADGLLGVLMSRSENVLVFSDHGFGPDPNYLSVLVFSPMKAVEAYRRVRGLTEAPAIRYVFEERAQAWSLFVEGGASADGFARGLADFLRQARYLPAGTPVFSGVETRSQGGEAVVRFVQQLPGSYPFRASGIDAGGSEHHLLDFFGMMGIQGIHMGNAMLALWGPGIKPGLLPRPVYMTDVAPTALYLLGLPAGADMDGRLIRDAIAPDVLNARPPREVASYGAGESVWSRLWRAVRWGELLGRLTGRAATPPTAPR